MTLLNKEKIVVFDMDETLGYFVEFAMFWELLKKYQKNNIESIFKQDYFNKLLNIFSEFIRPNILTILNFVKIKKISKKCQGVMIYTNNQGPKEWAYLIINYFHHKLNYKLFDRVISAFKVNGKHIELCRTTHDKTIEDFTRCTRMPENVEICYLDDTYYPHMNAENVYYIKIKPYVHDLPFKEMIHRFINSSVSKNIIKNKTDELEFIEFMEINVQNYAFVDLEKNKKENDIDKIVSKKILMHLNIFFKKGNSPSNKKSLKKNIKKNDHLKTRRIRR